MGRKAMRKARDVCGTAAGCVRAQLEVDASPWHGRDARATGRRFASVTASAIALVSAIGLAGCTVHPAGESAERRAAINAGRVYVHKFDERPIPPLPDNASADDLARYAMMSNADLEQKYWDWRAAL